MKQFLLTTARVTAWVLLTGIFWSVVFTFYRNGRAVPVFFVWLGALALFAICYKLSPRVPWLEEKPL